jgi:ABC-type dipeptide/oligopeptide/nickel transport system permease subunit
MWWKFRRHHMAIVGLSVLGVFLFISLVPEFLAPYGTQTRNLRYAQGPPMGVHFIDSAGTFHVRPYVYGWASRRDPVTLRRITTVDESKLYPIQWFVQGEPYKLFMLYQASTHLFGVEGSKVHLVIMRVVEFIRSIPPLPLWLALAAAWPRGMRRGHSSAGGTYPVYTAGEAESSSACPLENATCAGDRHL